jgi:hypothetical protein
MTTHDTWILVSVPGRPSARRVTTRVGLALLAWSEQRPARRHRSVELGRVERPLPAPRPFC